MKLWVGFERRQMRKLTWSDIEQIAEELAEKIKASGFEPEYIWEEDEFPEYFL